MCEENWIPPPPACFLLCVLAGVSPLGVLDVILSSSEGRDWNQELIKPFLAQASEHKEPSLLTFNLVFTCLESTIWCLEQGLAGPGFTL